MESTAGFRLRSFALNAGIMTVTSLALGALGVAYNAWLTRNLGNEGTGLFSLMMAVYRLAVTFAGGGGALAATRLVAENKALGNGKAAGRSMVLTICYCLITGIVAGALLFGFSQFTAEKLVGDIRAARPFRILSFSLPFIGVSSAIGGYFTAVTRVLPTSAAQVTEQLSQMAFNLLVFAVLKPSGMEKACMLVAWGSTVSELFALLLHGILYIIDKRKYPFNSLGRAGTVETLGRMLGIALPVGASAVLRSSLSTIKHLTIPVSLMKSGLTKAEALSQYGIIGGMVLPILLFPCAFLLGFSNLLVPEVTRCKALGYTERINSVMEKVFRLTLMFAIGVAAILLRYAREFAVLLYEEPAAAPAIKALAPIVAVMYLDSAVDGILKGIGEQVAVVRYNVYDALLCLIMVYTVVPVFGTVGYLATIALSEIFNMFLSASRLIYVTGFEVRMLRWAALPSLLSALSIGTVLLIFKTFTLSTECAGGLCLAVFVFILSYGIFLRVSGCLNGDDIALVRKIFAKK